MLVVWRPTHHLLAASFPVKGLEWPRVMIPGPWRQAAWQTGWRPQLASSRLTRWPTLARPGAGFARPGPAVPLYEFFMTLDQSCRSS